MSQVQLLIVVKGQVLYGVLRYIMTCLSHLESVLSYCVSYTFT